MADVIPFPERRRPAVEVDVLGPMDECSGLIHVFNEVPGRCQCGENEWLPDHTLEPKGDAIGLHAVE